jgi:hypothetical protein
MSAFCQPNLTDGSILDDVTTLIRFALLGLLTAASAPGQSDPATSAPAESGTSNDLFIMFGSDPRAARP